MKRNIFILVAFLVGSVLFANTPTDSSTFDITTIIPPVNEIRVTVEDLDGATNWTDITTFSLYNVDEDGFANNKDIAFLSIISNRRGGYNVSMKVEAMKSDTAYINYTIKLNGESVTTNNGTAVTESDIIKVTSLSQMTGVSYPINLTINSNDYNTAVEGTYTGTVTFEYVAN